MYCCTTDWPGSSHYFVDPECARSKLRKISNITLEKKNEITRLQRARTTQGKAIHLNQMFTTSRVALSLFLPHNAITQPIWFEFCSVYWRKKPRLSVSMSFFWFPFYNAKITSALKDDIKNGNVSSIHSRRQSCVPHSFLVNT